MSDELTHLRSANSGLRKIVVRQKEEIDRLRGELAKIADWPGAGRMLTSNDMMIAASRALGR